jgi:WD40 repeat protein
MAVAWSPDDRWTLTASKDKSARIWDARTGALQRTLVGHRDWSSAARKSLK